MPAYSTAIEEVGKHKLSRMIQLLLTAFDKIINEINTLETICAQIKEWKHWGAILRIKMNYDYLWARFGTA